MNIVRQGGRQAFIMQIHIGKAFYLGRRAAIDVLRLSSDVCTASGLGNSRPGLSWSFAIPVAHSVRAKLMGRKLPLQIDIH